MATEHFKVAGVSHYESNLMLFFQEDSDYSETKSYMAEHYFDGDRIYKYYSANPWPAKLIDEPENQFDPKAIRVEIGGRVVGYIKSGSTSHVRNLLKNPAAKVTAEILGGPYKEICTGDEGKLSIEKGEYAFSVKLTISIDDGVGESPTVDAATAVSSNDQIRTQPNVAPEAPSPSTEEKGKKKKKVSPVVFWIIAALYMLLGFSLTGVVYKVICIAVAIIFAGVAVTAKKNQKKQ